MRKIKIVEYTSVVLFFIYLFLLLGNLTFGFLKDYDIIVFSIFLAIISLNQVYKGVLLKSSSTMWFSMMLIFYAILIIVCEIFNLKDLYMLFFYLMIPIIPSIINIIIFHNLIYLKLIIFNISLVIPFLCYYFITKNVYIIVLISCMSFLMGVFICRFLNFKKERV